MEENKELVYVCITLDPVGVSTLHILPYQSEKCAALTVNAESDFLKMPSAIVVVMPKLESLVLPENPENLVLYEDFKIAMKKSIFEFVVSDFSKPAIYQIGVKLQNVFFEIENQQNINEADNHQVYGYSDLYSPMGRIYSIQSETGRYLFREVKRYILNYAKTSATYSKNKHAFFHYASSGEIRSVKTVECNELENYKA